MAHGVASSAWSTKALSCRMWCVASSAVMAWSSASRTRRVSDGASGVGAALKQHYDLGLLAFNLPEISGLEALAIVRSKGYSGPIGLFGSLSDDDEHRRIHDAGFDVHAPMPFTRDDFVDANGSHAFASAKRRACGLHPDSSRLNNVRPYR